MYNFLHNFFPDLALCHNPNDSDCVRVNRKLEIETYLLRTVCPEGFLAPQTMYIEDDALWLYQSLINSIWNLFTRLLNIIQLPKYWHNDK